MERRLSDLIAGQGAIIKAVSGNESMRRRLIDLGFDTGATVLCLFYAPLNDPCAYLVKGSVIALRKEDAYEIILQPTRDEERRSRLWD